MVENRFVGEGGAALANAVPLPRMVENRFVGEGGAAGTTYWLRCSGVEGYPQFHGFYDERVYESNEVMLHSNQWPPTHTTFLRSPSSTDEPFRRSICSVCGSGGLGHPERPCEHRIPPSEPDKERVLEVRWSDETCLARVTALQWSELH